MAIRASAWLAGDGLEVGWPDTAAWVGTPTGSELTRFTVSYDTLLGILAIIGGIWAIRRWRAYEIHRWTAANPRPDAVDAAAERHAIA
jgi:hypothetical protein